MSEEAAKEKKWTEWSVVSMDDGTLRCKRANVKDEEDAEYRQVVRPTFEPHELAGMIAFGKLELISPDDIAAKCYDNRYRANAFRLCARLNAEAK